MYYCVSKRPHITLLRFAAVMSLLAPSPPSPSFVRPSILLSPFWNAYARNDAPGSENGKWASRLGIGIVAKGATCCALSPPPVRLTYVRILKSRICSWRIINLYRNTYSNVCLVTGDHIYKSNWLIMTHEADPLSRVPESHFGHVTFHRILNRHQYRSWVLTLDWLNSPLGFYIFLWQIST